MNKLNLLWTMVVFWGGIDFSPNKQHRHVTTANHWVRAKLALGLGLASNLNNSRVVFMGLMGSFNDVKTAPKIYEKLVTQGPKSIVKDSNDFEYY